MGGGSRGAAAAFRRSIPTSPPMAITDRFSPFGIALFGVLIAGLLFFAYLMLSRGDNPNGDAPDGGYTGGAESMTVPAPAQP